jgi:hypothetical protein
MSHDAPSLLPYLAADGGPFRLSLSAEDHDPRGSGGISSPFPVVSDSDPLADLVEARFVTDAGSELRRVFLLKQKDRYLVPADAFWPLANPDVDAAWREAFSFHAAAGRGRSPAVLSAQLDGAGGLVPLDPLFLCSTRQAFFHPPCPVCGRPLRLCEDDDLLAAEGLKPYSGSLRRYLFCSPCAAASRSGYHAFEADRSDPPAVRDRWALIEAFARLRDGADPACRFPCGGCPDRADCCGPEARIRERIVPFSFYPFHMLVFEAPDLGARDFLSLLSGASPEEVAARLSAEREYGRLGRLDVLRRDGRLSAPFLGDPGDRRFLEVLYLKLSFLEAVFRTLRPEDGAPGRPDLRPSLDRIWIRLGSPGGLLPAFWTFGADVLDIRRHLPAACRLPGPPAYDDLLFLGLLWFHALLANAGQDHGAVSRSLREPLEAALHGGDPMSGGTGGAFSPLNTFWNPEGKRIREEWLPFWERALRLGWSLLGSGARSDPGWSAEAFRRQTEALRDEIKDRLFRDGPTDIRPEAPDEDLSAESEAIRAILDRVLGKWKAGVEAEGEETRETVVLRRDEAAGGTPSIGDPVSAREEADAPLRGPDAGGDISETVILGPPGSPSEALDLPAGPEPGGPDPEKTAFLFLKDGEERGAAPQAAGRPSPKAGGGEPSGESALSDTVILRPETKESDSRETSRSAAAGMEDPLAETTILGRGSEPAAPGGPPGAQSPDAARKARSAPAPDILTETVILRPGGESPGAPRVPDAGRDAVHPAGPEAAGREEPAGVPDAGGTDTEDGTLDETVILKPSADLRKERKPRG